MLLLPNYLDFHAFSFLPTKVIPLFVGNNKINRQKVFTNSSVFIEAIYHRLPKIAYTYIYPLISDLNQLVYIYIYLFSTRRRCA